MTRRREPLRIKPYQGYDPNRKPRTPAQEKAARRTWQIIQLRSQWVLSTVSLKRGWRLWAVRWLLDSELRRLKAEPHGKRFKAQQAAFAAELAEHRTAHSPF